MAHRESPVSPALGSIAAGVKSGLEGVQLGIQDARAKSHALASKVLDRRKSIATSIVNVFYGPSGGDVRSASQDSEPPGERVPLRENDGGAPSCEEDAPGRDEVESRPGRPETPYRRQNAVSSEVLDLSVLVMLDKQQPPWIVNPHFPLRHPMLRLIAVWLIILLDFYIYGSDPVQDSHVPYPYFGVFEDLFIIKWPEEWYFKVSRIFLFVFVTILSLVFARKIVHHWLLRDKLGLQMFSDNNGTILVQFLVWVAFFEYVLPYPINLMESGTTTQPLTEDSVLLYHHWGKIWQSTAACADMVSIIMITDTVLQDRTVWPNFLPGLKTLWNDRFGGWVRVIAAWSFALITLPLIISGLYVSGHENGIYDTENAILQEYPTAQWMRVGIAAFLTMVDITTCLQDWEFPSFNTPVNFKVAGTFWHELNFPFISDALKACFRCCKCIPEDFWDTFHFQMSGKWVAYLPAFGALSVDWWYMCRTIYGYKPENLGQYAAPDCVLWVIKDQQVISRTFTAGVLNEGMGSNITWEVRGGAQSGDSQIHSKYCTEYEARTPLLVHLCLGVGVASGVLFIVLICRAEYYWDNYMRRHTANEVHEAHNKFKAGQSFHSRVDEERE